MQDQFVLKSVIYIGSTSIDMVVARVGEGWMEPVMESTHLFPVTRAFSENNPRAPESHDQLVVLLTELRNHIFEKYGMIPVELFAGTILAAYARRIELNWLIEEATGYRVFYLNDLEEERFSVYDALQKPIVTDESFNSLVAEIKKASETDAF